MSVPISRAERERVLAAWEKNRARAWEFDAESWRQWMSGPVKTAVVTIKARVRFTGDMPEDRVLDAVIATVKVPDIDLHVDGDDLEIMSVKYLCIVEREGEGL